ncbi:hypothetical protein WJX77_003979 [Trebouxia sp. C0004]
MTERFTALDPSLCEIPMSQSAFLDSLPGWETPDAGQCPDGRNEDSEHDDAQSVLPQTQPHVPAACPEGCFEQQQAANSASVGKLGSPLPVSPSRTVDQEASVDLSLKLESEYTACNSSPDDFSPLQLSLTQQLDMSDSMREGEACMTPSADAKGHGAAGLQINLNQIQQLSNSLHTSVSGLDAANASDMAAQPGSAHHMQNRSLGGFLSPLGKLAGMFGWAPGKSAEHFNAMPVSGVPPVANSNRDRDGHSQSGVGQQLARLVTSADASIGEIQTSLPVNLLQMRPDQLTVHQLQNLQKAADLLSPRSSAPWQLQMPSMSGKNMASNMPGTTTRPAPRSMPAHDPLQQQAMTSSNQHEVPLQRNCHGASPAGMGQASRAVDAAVAPDAMPYAEPASQEEDDALAAALSSRLASMAPHPSSLCTDTLAVGSTRQLLLHSSRRHALDDDVCKRKREEEPNMLQHVQGMPSCRPESAVQLIERQSRGRTCSEYAQFITIVSGVGPSTPQKVQKNNRFRGFVPLYAFIVAEYS